MTKLPLEADPLPIRVDDESGGALRVGPTRVTVETVLGTFRSDVSAEEIIARYPTLSLADVYAVIAHYLRHRAEFDAYLDECDRLFEQRRAEALANGQAGWREELQARIAKRQGNDASVSH